MKLKKLAMIVFDHWTCESKIVHPLMVLERPGIQNTQYVQTV
jgi:hypothetical protein